MGMVTTAFLSATNADGRTDTLTISFAPTPRMDVDDAHVAQHDAQIAVTQPTVAVAYRLVERHHCARGIPLVHAQGTDVDRGCGHARCIARDARHPSAPLVVFRGFVPGFQLLEQHAHIAQDLGERTFKAEKATIERLGLAKKA